MLITCAYMLASILIAPVAHSRCYSCAGTCYSEPCNCQMGSCESDYCFIERKPTDERGRYRITKGCVRRPSRIRMGCDYKRFRDHMLCTCHGDFCNDVIYMRLLQSRNISCRNCSERSPDCSQSCQGQWCHEDTTTGASGCGYGPPSLPYFYEGSQLLDHRSRVCVTISRGSGMPRRHCICSTNYCNAFFKGYYQWGSISDGSSRTRSLLPSNSQSIATSMEYHTCVNCELSSHDASVTASCKQNQCVGNYCTYAAQRLLLTAGGGSGGGGHHQRKPRLNERQGCINVTDHTHVHLGCSHKWMSNEEEEIYCACRGAHCNRDPATASLDQASGISLHCLIILALFIVHCK